MPRFRMRNRMAVPLLLMESGITYLLRDDFNMDDAAPVASPRTAEPGPGEWDTSGGTNRFAISGGELVMSAGASAEEIATIDTYGGNSLAVFKATKNTGLNTYHGFFPTVSAGLAVSQSGFRSPGGIHPIENGLRAYVDLNPLTAAIYKSSDDLHQLYVYDGTNWALVAVDQSSLAAHKFRIRGNSTPDEYDTDFVHIISPAASLFDPAIEVASPGVGALTDAPDGDIFMQVAAPSSGAFELEFRKQDANNYWLWDVDVTTGEHRLLEYVAGSPTTRITATVTINSGDTMTLSARGSDITIWRNNTQDGTYASATNFQNETGLEVASAGTGTANLNVWKAYATGTLAAQLNQAVS